MINNLYSMSLSLNKNEMKFKKLDELDNVEIEFIRGGNKILIPSLLALHGSACRKTVSRCCMVGCIVTK
jgi:hypothetical protein